MYYIGIEIILLISDSFLFFASLSRMNKPTLPTCCAEFGGFFVVSSYIIAVSHVSWAADAAFCGINLYWDFFVVVWREVPEGTVHFLICSPEVLDINPPQTCAGMKKYFWETAAAFICVHHSKDEVRAHHLKSHVRLVSLSHCYKVLNTSQCHFC